MSENATKGFRITSGKGFHITFENGWTVSVQFGPLNYCDNRPPLDLGHNIVEHVESLVENISKSCVNAEIAAWDKNNEWHKFEDEDTVDGWVAPDKLLAFMNEVAKREG